MASIQAFATRNSQLRTIQIPYQKAEQATPGRISELYWASDSGGVNRITTAKANQSVFLIMIGYDYNGMEHNFACIGSPNIPPIQVGGVVLNAHYTVPVSNGRAFLRADIKSVRPGLTLLGAFRSGFIYRSAEPLVITE